MRLSQRFSKILVKNWSRLIGRKEDIKPSSLLGLGTKIMVDIFTRLEITKVLKRNLKYEKGK